MNRKEIEREREREREIKERGGGNLHWTYSINY